MAGTVRIYRPEGSPYVFVDEEKLMGEMEVRGQFKQIREVLAKPGPLLRICNWVGHLSQGTKNNVKRGPEKNRNFEKSKNRKIEKIEKSKFCRSKFPI